jgi:hypothetical protein
MEQIMNWEPTKDEATQLQAILEDCVQSMRKANEQIAKDKTEFDRLKAETEEIIHREWKAA